jgi:hypothetical protein
MQQQVRDATRAFRDVNDAIAAGYSSLGSCVSGSDQGAMGIPRRTASGAWFWSGTSC